MTSLSLLHLMLHADLETEGVVEAAIEAVDADEDADAVVLGAAAMPVAAVARQHQIIKAPNLIENASRERPLLFPALVPRDNRLVFEEECRLHPCHQIQTDIRQRLIPSL